MSGERTVDQPFAAPDFFSAFAFIWGATSLIHQLAFSFWVETWPGWMLVIAACAVIHRSSCLVRFTVLICCSLANLVYKLPFVPNHILFEGLIHVTMLLVLLGQWLGGTYGSPATVIRSAVLRFWPLLLTGFIKWAYLGLDILPHNHVLGGLTTVILLFGLSYGIFRRTPVERGDSFIEAFAPLLRIEIVIMYVWAAVQKMNWDYIDPTWSCAAELHKEIADYFFFVPGGVWSQHVAIWGSYVFELGIPLLLLIPRIRWLGFVAAIWFHLWLSIHPAAGIFSYSSLILAALYVFLPRSIGAQLAEIWVGWTRWMGRGNAGRGLTMGRWLIIGLFFVTLFTQAYLYLTMQQSQIVFETANRVGFFTWLTWGIWLSSGYLWAWYRPCGQSTAWLFRPQFGLGVVGVLLVFSNGLNPWLGLKTQTSFSMYSNLRSEAEGNHMFLRRVDLFGFQKDMVEILELQPNRLLEPEKPRSIRYYANTGMIMPWFELRRLMGEETADFRVVYIRDGETHTVERRSGETDHPELFEPLPWWQYKTLWFRRHESLTDPMHCTH